MDEEPVVRIEINRQAAIEQVFTIAAGYYEAAVEEEKSKPQPLVNSRTQIREPTLSGRLARFIEGMELVTSTNARFITPEGGLPHGGYCISCRYNGIDCILNYDPDRGEEDRFFGSTEFASVMTKVQVVYLAKLLYPALQAINIVQAGRELNQQTILNLLNSH